MNTVHEIEETRVSTWEVHSSDPAISLGQIREMVRRAYAAGCDAHEFHEADCQEETSTIVRDLLPGTRRNLITFDEVLAARRDVVTDRIEEVHRFINLVMSAAASTPGRADDVDYEAGVVTVELDGYGLTERLKIPAHLLLGMDPRYVPAIVDSYVEAYRASIEAPGVSRRDFEEIATLLDFAGARFVSKNDVEVADIAKRMLVLSVKLAMALGRAS